MLYIIRKKNIMSIKAVLLDFDQTLFETKQARQFWHQDKPDWDRVLSFVPHFRLYNGWRWVLSFFDDMPWGIVSKNVKKVVIPTLQNNGLTFSPVITRYGEKWWERVSLPKTALFEQALTHSEFAGLQRGEVLYVGDQATDVVQANSFGFLSAAAYWDTLEPDKLAQTQPTFRLSTPLDLFNVLLNN